MASTVHIIPISVNPVRLTVKGLNNDGNSEHKVLMSKRVSWLSDKF